MTGRWRKGRAAWGAAGLVLLVSSPGAGIPGAPAAAQTPPATPAPATAQPPAGTAPFESRPYRYAVALPTGCRHVEGPGTIDAVCSADFALETSAVAKADGALVLAVAAEAVAGGGDATAAGIAQRYSEARFKAELPEAVCGETNPARIKIRSVEQTTDDGRVVYTADVGCAPVKFLRIAARRAIVRHVAGPDMIYRLMARAPEQAFEKQRGTIDAFLASFRVLASEPFQSGTPPPGQAETTVGK